MRKSGKKFWMWTIGTIALLVMASIIGWFFLKKELSVPNSGAEKKMSELFTKMIIEASDSLYKVSYTKFDIDLASGRGTITNFKLTADSVVLKRLSKSHRQPNNLMDISIHSLHIDGLHFTKTDQGRKLGIQNIILQKPSIKIVNKLQAYRINGDQAKQRNFFSLVQTLFKLCEIKTLTIRQMDFAYLNNNGPALRRTDLKNLNVDISGLTAVESNIDGTKSTAIRILKNKLATPDSLYFLTIEDFKFMPGKGLASIKLAELRPRLGKTAFFKSVKWAKDRILIIYHDLSIKHINLQQFLEKQHVQIGLMQSSSSFAEVYTNYSWPRHIPPIRPYPFPHQQLKNIAFDITIDTMKLNNAETHWRVFAAHSRHVSSLDILKTNGTILNLTNNRERIATTGYTNLSVHCLVNNAAPMHLKMNFNLKDNNGEFTASSIMGKMDARLLNRFSEPFSMIRIKEGIIDQMELQLKANDKGGSGNVNLYYTGMKIALLKRDKETNKLKQRKLISAISNAILPNDNPTKNGKFKKGPINVRREANQSFFGFLSKCMIDGMSSAMTGLAQEKKKKDSNIITKIGGKIVGQPNKMKKNNN